MRPNLPSRLVIGCTLLALTAPSVFAVTRHVTSLGNTGAGSLRNVLGASGNGDTIIFDVTGTITLTSGELLVSHNVTISGPGAAFLTVARSSAGGTPEFRVFNISNGTTSGPIVSVSGLTVYNGKVSGSPPANYGGGIFNDHGTLTITNCSVTGNAAQYGSGILSSGMNSGTATVTVTGCTFSSNSASGAGGGIYSFGTAASLTVTNSTFIENSGNTTGGGGIFNSGFNLRIKLRVGIDLVAGIS